MRMSLRPDPSILAAAVVAAVAVPAGAQAAVISPSAPACTVAAPAPGSIQLIASPTTIVAHTRPRLTYVIRNVGKTCVGIGASPYGIQISGFAGWSNWQWNLGIQPQYVRLLQPGESTAGRTVPVPSNLIAGGYFRFVPHFVPDSAQPVASVPLTIVP